MVKKNFPSCTLPKLISPSILERVIIEPDGCLSRRSPGIPAFVKLFKMINEGRGNTID
jgi:hypothetical protein